MLLKASMNKVQQRIVLVALTFVVFLLLASYFLAMLLGPALFFLTPAGLDFSRTLVQPPVSVGFFVFYVPFSLNNGQLFMVIWGVFALCFVIAWKSRENFHEVVGKAFSRPLSRIFNNWLFAMPIIASTLYSAVVLIIELQDLFRVPTGALPTPMTDTEIFDLYLNLMSYAPLIEEVGFRILPIGALLFIYLLLIKSEKDSSNTSFWQSFKLFLFSFLYPDGAKRMIGEKTVAANGILNGISKGEWIIILITSITFGVAHVISGAGWEIGKVTSTFVQGFVFSIVYVAYGFQAPILTHWFFNYYFYTYDLSNFYFTNMFYFFAWIENITLTLGRLGLIAFTVLGLKKILNHRKTVTRKPSAF